MLISDTCLSGEVVIPDAKPHFNLELSSFSLHGTIINEFQVILTQISHPCAFL